MAIGGFGIDRQVEAKDSLGVRIWLGFVKIIAQSHERIIAEVELRPRPFQVAITGYGAGDRVVMDPIPQDLALLRDRHHHRLAEGDRSHCIADHACRRAVAVAQHYRGLFVRWEAYDAG
ncbi:hypothetical protein FB595_1463 [Sphingobium sp. AEW010]|nr:hypothetical protein FB595_1463 [Sphingobium sp. AEW010]TWD16430.1 hypothetical protein FB596_1473 [Sphingobium sp. AEW013]TWD19754.1 hypothetical protein FB594_1473 [Sphingobium sp. AEW001]